MWSVLGTGDCTVGVTCHGRGQYITTLSVVSFCTPQIMNFKTLQIVLHLLKVIFIAQIEAVNCVRFYKCILLFGTVSQGK